jgi:hypothetical protein
MLVFFMIFLLGFLNAYTWSSYTADGSIHSTGKAIATFLTSGEAVRVQQPVTVHQNGTVVVVSDTHVTDETFKKIGKTSVFTCKLGESAFFFA